MVIVLLPSPLAPMAGSSGLRIAALRLLPQSTSLISVSQNLERELRYKLGVSVNSLLTQVFGVSPPISSLYLYPELTHLPLSDQGNPLVTWPELVDTAPANTSADVSQQITSVVLGYGIQVTFYLTNTAYSAFTEALSSAQSSSGSISIFGFLYGSGGKLHSSPTTKK